MDESQRERNQAVGKRVKVYRQRIGMRQQDVAHAVGVSLSTVSKWESGDNGIDRAMIERLANLFQCTPAELLGPQEESEELVRLFVESARMLSVGRTLPSALDRTTGNPSLLSEEERRLLTEQSRALRDFVMQQAGREFDLLTEEQQFEIGRQVLRLMRRMLEGGGNNSSGHPEP